MDGYFASESIHNVTSPNTNPPFWLFFYWICKYYNHNGSYYNWDCIILMNCENDEEKALDTFFERFDEFQKFKPFKIFQCEVNGNEITTTDVKITKVVDGKEMPVEPANKAVVVEYDKDFGSSVYHMKSDKVLDRHYYFNYEEAIENVVKEYGEGLQWEETPATDVENVHKRIIDL